MKEHPRHCLRQQSDQMTCTHCGKVWDMNDPEPPACGDQDHRKLAAQQWLHRIRRNLEKGKK
jgi:hypothetical protein